MVNLWVVLQWAALLYGSLVIIKFILAVVHVPQVLQILQAPRGAPVTVGLAVRVVLALALSCSLFVLPILWDERWRFFRTLSTQELEQVFRQMSLSDGE